MNLKIRNFGLPLFSGLLGLGMLFETRNLSMFQLYTGLGEGFMVAFIGVALVLIAVILAVQVMRGVDFSPEEGEGVDLTVPLRVENLTLALFGVALPVVTIPWLGFPLGASLAYVCVTRAFGSPSWLKDWAIGFVVASLTWFVFTKLGVQLGSFMPFGGK